MTKTGLIAVRHGRTKLNHEDLSLDRIRGWKDIPLNAEGIKEAISLSEKFKDYPIYRIYSSDLGRAYRTAQIINRFHEVSIIKTKALRPWGLGKFEGKITKDVLPELTKYFTNENLIPEDGESFKTFRIRALTSIRQMINEVKLKKILIIISTHYRDLKLIEAWVKKGMPDDMSIDSEIMKQDGVNTGETYEIPIK